MRQKLFTFLLLVFLPMTVLAADTVYQNGICYSVERKAKVATVIYNDQQPYSGDVVIPGSIVYGGVTCYVTGIGEKAFYCCDGLTSVTIPDGVTSIGNGAFLLCNDLASVNIPDGVTSIGEQAFEGSGLTSITIPSSVTSIGQGAFGSCNHLKTAELHCATIGTWLSWSESLQKVIIGDEAVSIESDAFENCFNLEEVMIGNGVTAIGSGAFYNCGGLSTVIFGNSVTSIGRNAFCYCISLRSITCKAVKAPSVADNTFEASTFEHATLYVPKGCVTVYKNANVWRSFGTVVEMVIEGITFADQGVKSICVSHWDTNGDGELSEEEAAAVTEIGEEFYKSKEITSFDELQLFVNLRTIKDNAFYDCRSLTSITLPETLLSIGDKAFFNCTSLTSIHIPASVTSIGNAITSCCSALQTITVDKSNRHYDSRDNCNAIMATATGALIAGSNNTVIPEGTTAIGDEAMRGMYDLQAISLPKGLRSIGNSAFYYCRSAEGALVIPEGCTAVGTYAFHHCVGIQFINIPSTVTTLGAHAFRECSAVEMVRCAIATPPTIGATTFGNYANCTLMVPAASIDLYKSASVWKTSSSSSAAPPSPATPTATTSSTSPT